MNAPSNFFGMIFAEREYKKTWLFLPVELPEGNMSYTDANKEATKFIVLLVRQLLYGKNNGVILAAVP